MYAILNGNYGGELGFLGGIKGCVVDMQCKNYICKILQDLTKDLKDLIKRSYLTKILGKIFTWEGFKWFSERLKTKTQSMEAKQMQYVSSRTTLHLPKSFCFEVAMLNIECLSFTKLHEFL